jgi:hypothetical protein
MHPDARPISHVGEWWARDAPDTWIGALSIDEVEGAVLTLTEELVISHPALRQYGVILGRTTDGEDITPASML